MTPDQQADLDRDRNTCLEVIREGKGKPVPFNRLCLAAGKRLAPGPAVKILTAIDGIQSKRHKGKLYFLDANQSYG